MKTDLLLIPMSARYRDMRAAAVAAEEAGFDGLWTWDHLRDPDGGPGPGVPEAWTVLTALAEATRRIALGPLVLNVANRHPGVLANMAATLQAVSGGRLLLGIGAGGSQRTPYAAEQQAIGQSVERDAVRARKVVEAIDLMRRRCIPSSPTSRAWRATSTRPPDATRARSCSRCSPVSTAAGSIPPRVRARTWNGSGSRA
jgi:alkanesulfonate monooxygenase SsuD/methylene tetrahydromethanopterin reductase-like flavin-dependent oxidoreductase (luciferase family)